MSKIIGIDLGTTNSCAAVVDVTKPMVIPNREGARTTPSVVAFTSDDARLVGQIARRQSMTNPMNTAYAVKRLIGRKFDSEEVKWARTLVPYAIVESESGDACVEIKGRSYSPPEISAFVLREIVAVSGLEMAQNSMRYGWTREEVDNRLQLIMKSIHETCVTTAEKYSTSGNYQNRHPPTRSPRRITVPGRPHSRRTTIFRHR